MVYFRRTLVLDYTIAAMMGDLHLDLEVESDILLLIFVTMILVSVL